MKKLLNRLHLYKNQDQAKASFKTTKTVFETGKFGSFEVIINDLVIICQGIKLQFRGSHNLEEFLKGRELDKAVIYYDLTQNEKIMIKERLINSKVINPLECH